MPSLILLMIAGAAVVGWWNASRAAAELDQSVHANGLRLYRRDDGWLGLERSFRFDYSYDGYDRHHGRMVLRGDRLVEFVGPARSASIVPLDRE